MVIDHWKWIIRQANKAFSRQQLPLAEMLYQQAVQLLWQNWPTVMAEHSSVDNNEEQPSTLLVICLSISIQNLAETYARQQRWRRCLSVLRRAMTQWQQLQYQLPAEHPALVALLRESCSLRRELCRYSKLQQDTIKHKTRQQAGFVIPVLSATVH